MSGNATGRDLRLRPGVRIQVRLTRPTGEAERQWMMKGMREKCQGKREKGVRKKGKVDIALESWAYI